MRVLVVDDDPSMREGLADILSPGAEVRTAGSALEASDALALSSFDMVITDLRIGGDYAGGRRVIAAARQHGAVAVLVSGATREEIDRTLGDQRADAVITKPFSIDTVEALLRWPGRRAV